MTELLSVLDAMAFESCQTLASTPAVRRVPTGDEQEPSELVAVIGFSGDLLRGAVGLTGTREALRATHPATLAGETTNPEQLDDWLAEMVNQLLGRFKAHLHRRGVGIWMSTPLLLRGLSLSVASSGDQVHRYELVLSGGHVFTFWLDLNADAGLTLGEIAEGDANTPNPGDVLFF